MNFGLKCSSERIALQFKLMKSNKEAASIIANIAQMILQSRISPHPQQLQRIETVKSEIDVLRSHLNPSDEVLYFLIDREHYQIKNKVLTQQRKRPQDPLIIHIRFTIFDKQTSITETAQIWKIQLNRKQVNSLRPGHCVKELLNLVREVTTQLTSSYNFSEIVRNKEINKKYVIDFKIEVGSERKSRQKIFEKEFHMKNCRARINDILQVKLNCYWRENINLPSYIVSPYAAMQHRKHRKISEQTRVDSCSIGSLKDVNVKKYKSIDQQQQTFEVYDSQLDVTILSSDSDSLSHSRNIIRQITIGQTDEFELLIEQNTTDDELFIIQNEVNFQNWQRYLHFNFH